MMSQRKPKVLKWDKIDITSETPPNLNVKYDSNSLVYTTHWIIADFGGERPMTIIPKSVIGKHTARISFSALSAADPVLLRIAFSGLTTGFNCQYYVRLRNSELSKSLEVRDTITLSASSSTISVYFNTKAGDFVPEKGWFIDGKPQIDLELSIGEEVKIEAPVSTEVTMYAGLHNQGATCYLNSMLQGLFHIPAFRSIVFRMPTTGNEDPKKSIPLCLQRLFYEMQTTKGPCSTKALTTSFGWVSRETIMQHDAQEFSRLLLDNLEKKMMGTDLEDEIANLFRGKYCSYIRCTNVPYESSNVQTFYDLSMPVKGFPNLLESFKGYTEKELLSGDNQYQTDEFGKQDAYMGTEFISFPDVLQLQLRRFEFNYRLMRMSKVNDRFEFPVILDLSEFVNDGKSNIFELFTVLVHSGGSGGHYYSFVRTTEERRWFKFNDSRVTEESEETVVKSNFGGSTKPFAAYLLIYVRQSEINRIYSTCVGVPRHIKEYEESKPAEEERMIKVGVYDYSVLCNNTANCNLAFNKPKFIAEFEVGEKTTFVQLYDKVSSEAHVENKTFRLWKTSVPCSLITKNKEKTIGSITRGRETLALLIQKKPSTESIVITGVKNPALIAVKFFYPGLENPFRFIDVFPVANNEKVSNLVPKVNEAVGLQQDQQLLCYIEMTDKSAEPVDLTSTFNDMNIRSGSSLIFQCVPDEKVDLSSVADDVRLPDQAKKFAVKAPKTYNCFDILTELRNGHVDTWMCEHYNTIQTTVFDIEDTATPLFNFIIPRNMSYNDLVKALMIALGIEISLEKDSVFLFSNDEATNKPNTHPIDPSSSLRISVNSKLYFQIMKGVSADDLKRMSLYSFQVSTDGYNVTFSDTILADKNITSQDLLTKLEENGIIKVPESAVLRCSQIRDCRYIREINIDDQIVNPFLKIRVDILTEEQSKARLIQVCHCSIDEFGAIHYDDDPFMFPLIEGEPLEDTRCRIMSTVKINQPPIDIQLQNINSMSFKDTILTGDVILSDKLQEGDILLFVHNRVERVEAKRRKEVALKIYN